MYNNDLSVFSFRNNSGTAQYSMNSGSTWTNFKNPVGTRYIYSNGTYDVTNYASAYVSVSASFSVVTTLWTNPSPTSSFAQQTVSWSGYSLSDYTASNYYLRFTYRVSTAISNEQQSIISVSNFMNIPSSHSNNTVAFGLVIMGSAPYDTYLGFVARGIRRGSNDSSIFISAAGSVGGTGHPTNQVIPTKIELCSL